ncbi:MAG: DUF1697 domain-containing protein [Gillisia sp.]
MKRYISVLRGINVGGKRKIRMLDLKALYLHLGFKNVVTFIQSGNVLFETSTEDSEKVISEKIRKGILEQFGFEVPVILRTLKEMEEIAERNPFQSSSDTGKLHVTLLAELPAVENCSYLTEASFLPDECRLINREIYIKCAGKYSDSKLTNNFIENKLKIAATTRNWKTFLKLLELAQNVQ